MLGIGGHVGTLQCTCNNRLGPLPFPLDSRTTHSETCQWSCCGLDWTHFRCQTPAVLEAVRTLIMTTADPMAVVGDDNDDDDDDTGMDQQ